MIVHCIAKIEKGVSIQTLLLSVTVSWASSRKAQYLLNVTTPLSSSQLSSIEVVSGLTMKTESCCGKEKSDLTLVSGEDFSVKGEFEKTTGSSWIVSYTDDLEARA